MFGEGFDIHHGWLWSLDYLCGKPIDSSGRVDSETKLVSCQLEEAFQCYRFKSRAWNCERWRTVEIVISLLLLSRDNGSQICRNRGSPGVVSREKKSKDG